MSDPALRTTDPAQLIAARQKVVEAQRLRDGAGTDLVKLRAATDLLIEAADAFALATVPVEHGTLHKPAGVRAGDIMTSANLYVILSTLGHGFCFR